MQTSLDPFLQMFLTINQTLLFIQIFNKNVFFITLHKLVKFNHQTYVHFPCYSVKCISCFRHRYLMTSWRHWKGGVRWWTSAKCFWRTDLKLCNNLVCKITQFVVHLWLSIDWSYDIVKFRTNFLLQCLTWNLFWTLDFWILCIQNRSLCRFSRYDTFRKLLSLGVLTFFSNVVDRCWDKMFLRTTYQCGNLPATVFEPRDL